MSSRGITMSEESMDRWQYPTMPCDKCGEPVHQSVVINDMGRWVCVKCYLKDKSNGKDVISLVKVT